MISAHPNRSWVCRASAWTAILALVLAPFGQVPSTQAQVGQGFNLNASDLRFIYQQIRIAERHAATRTASNPCGTLVGTDPDQIPTGTGQTILLPWGLRTVDGTCNHLSPGQENFGAADQPFPRLVPKNLRPAEAGTSYTQTSGQVTDSQPRIISNLIVDQTADNPAAVAAADGAVPDDSGTLFIPNVAPDTGLSAPFNSWFTLFGQFFDHGLDLVNKGGNGTVFIPLQSDDPLFNQGPNFMVLTRASHDGDHEANNQTSPFVDQSQTYTSHASHQVFLRQYELVGGQPVGTGRLITGPGEGMARWSDVKAQALTVLGIALTDQDALSIPLLATDPYGRFLRGPNGFPQMVKLIAGVPTLVEGSLSSPINTANAIATGHAFLDDIAHTANPANGTFDSALLGDHFIAGDGRVNENIGLTAVHHIFHSEHNRLREDILDHINNNPDFTPAERAAWSDTNGPAGWDLGERLFQAARFVTEMEYQHLAFEEFIRKVQPLVNPFGEGGVGFHPAVNPAIRAEFAHAVYRFGHSMLTETVARDTPQADIPLLQAFLNPRSFFDGGLASDPTGARKAAGAIIRGMTRQVGNEIDEFVTEALRNKLLGLPLDLPTLNMSRARDTGIPTLNAARRAFFAVTQNSFLTPYTSWATFGFALRHPESLVNFLAAYGKHPNITTAIGLTNKRTAAQLLLDAAAADNTSPAFQFLNSTNGWTTFTSGVEDIELWMGGLAERGAVFGGLLGPTFNYVFETQMEDLQDGDRFYYLSRTAGLNLLTQLEGNSFAELISRNTDAQGLPADVFTVPTCIFNPGPSGDPGCDADLVTLPDGTIRYNGPEHVLFNGTSNGDRIWSGEGDDTIRGNDGNDWVEGGDGNDNIVGGLGDDILLDLGGDDNIKGGDGNDVISSGQGFGGDLNQGGRGKDFIIGGNDTTETFGGPGDDFIYQGDAEDTAFGDDGDDWIETGRGPFALAQGDNGAPFQDDPNAPGHDVLMGFGGEVDYDSEGGADIMFLGDGIQRAEGMLGFDWAIHRGDGRPGDSDLRIIGALPPGPVETNRDRFDLTEALSGWIRDDILRGDNRTLTAVGAELTLVGHQLRNSGVNRIAGLSAIVPLAPGGGDPVAFAGGNILLGGAGSDILEGRGGNDILDGDRWLDAQIRVNPVVPGIAEFHDDLSTLRAAVLAGQINPGNLFITRSIKVDAPNVNDSDTAVFSGPLADYDIISNPNGSTTVIHSRGTQIDGTDTLWNIEILQFADQPVAIGDAASLNLVLPATADTFVRGGAANVNLNFGTQTVLQSRQQGTGVGVSRVYLKFQIPPIPNDAVIENVKLRLYVNDPSPNPQTVFIAGSNWTEANLTFTSASGVVRGAQVSTLAVPTNLNYAEFPLPLSTVVSNTEVNFEIAGGTDLASFHSREAASNRPQLVITLASDTVLPPSAPLNVAAIAGNASALVSWTAPQDDGGAPITGYTATATPGGATCTTTGLSCTVNGLTNGTAYTFRVVAANEAGSGLASNPSPSVTPTATAATTVTIVTNADAYVRSSQANRNFGTANTLVTRQRAGNIHHSYLRFNVQGLTPGVTYTATLRLFVNNASGNVNPVRAFTGTGWTETGITFDNAPTVNSTPVGTFNPNATGFINIPLTITPTNGVINLQIRSNGQNEAVFVSREGANTNRHPRLIFTPVP